MTGYPRRFDEIGTWAERQGIPVAEARRRFAQFAILAAIAGSRNLRSSLIFKGGNALDFVWQPNRSTLDLDFSVDHSALAFEIDEPEIQHLFATATTVVQRRYAIRLAVNSVRQQTPGKDRAFPTIVVRCGYALPDEPKLIARMDRGRPSSQVLDVEISVNEPLGAATAVLLDDSIPPLRIATLEDIVAEKLRALLQQPIRNRERRQDLLDIAVIVRQHSSLDVQQISDILLTKSRARGIDASRRAYLDPEIRQRAQVDYVGLRDTTRTLFIPFDEAWEEVMRLVSRLSIPDE
jgi:predicted nucleotidyltransferase component of viral defense system